MNTGAQNKLQTKYSKEKKSPYNKMQKNQRLIKYNLSK